MTHSSLEAWSPGGTLIFSNIRRLGPFLGVINFEFQYFFFWGGGGGFRKINIFWGMKILWIFLGGHLKIGLVLVFFLCTLASFLKVNIQNRDFLGCKNFR